MQNLSYVFGAILRTNYYLSIYVSWPLKAVYNNTKHRELKLCLYTSFVGFCASSEASSNADRFMLNCWGCQQRHFWLLLLSLFLTPVPQPGGSRFFSVPVALVPHSSSFLSFFSIYPLFAQTILNFASFVWSTDVRRPSISSIYY